MNAKQIDKALKPYSLKYWIYVDKDKTRITSPCVVEIPNSLIHEIHDSGNSVIIYAGNHIVTMLRDKAKLKALFKLSGSVE